MFEVDVLGLNTCIVVGIWTVYNSPMQGNTPCPPSIAYKEEQSQQLANASRLLFTMLDQLTLQS